MIIKALTIKEPWLALISQNRKTIETRFKRTSYRGPILLASSQTNSDDYAELVRMYFGNDDSVISWPMGRAYVLANLVDCRSMIFADSGKARCEFDKDLFAWVLEDIQIIKPLPVREMPGIFNVETDDYDLIRRIKNMSQKKTKKTSGKKRAKVKVVDKKTGQKRTAAESEPAKNVMGIETKARLSKIVIKPKCVDIDFKDMSLRADQVRRISIWTKDDEPLFITIDGNVGTKGKIAKCVTSVKGDEVVLSNLNFSCKQCQQLSIIVKSESEVDVRIVAETPNLYEGLDEEFEAKGKPESKPESKPEEGKPEEKKS